MFVCFFVLNSMGDECVFLKVFYISEAIFENEVIFILRFVKSFTQSNLQIMYRPFENSQHTL